MSIIRISLLFLVILVLLCPTNVFASEVDPDTFEIKTLNIYRNNIETGDFLIIMHYEFSYTVPANEPSLSTKYTALLMLLDGNTTLGIVEPFPFDNNGYGESAGSIYLDAASAPAWGGNYTVRLTGNPTIHFNSGNPTFSWSTVSADYNTSILEDDIESDIADYVIDIADDLETDWGVPGELYSALQTGLVLSEDMGGPYFAGAIPGLWYFSPDLFAVQSLSPTVTEANYTQAQQFAFEAQYDGTIVGRWSDSFGDLMGGAGAMTATSILVILGAVCVILICGVKFQKASPGFLISLPLLLFATAAGNFSFLVLGLICMAAAIAIGYLIFFKQGAG